MKLKYWNYRIVKENDSYSIREVYYNSNDKPTSWTKDADFLWTENVEDLNSILEMMIKGTKKPILEVKTKGKDKEYLEEIK